MSMSENPRAVMGGNNAPDYARLETERLTSDYSNFINDTAALLIEAREAPKEVTDDASAGIVSDLVVRIRSFSRRMEGLREAEKEPHLRRGNAVDQFWKNLQAKLTREKKGDPSGAADILQDRVHHYNEAKAAAARAALAEIERQERDKADAARRAQAEADRIAAAARQKEEDERAAAERARKPENIDARNEAADQHAAAARAQESAAAAAAEAARVAAQAADDAAVDAQRRSADLVRQRTSGGTLNTMRRVGQAKLVDKALVNLETLRPFMKDEHVEMALKAWAKTTGFKTQMEGAVIGMVDETVLR